MTRKNNPNMENFSNFTNKYQVSKTLRFRLEPIAGTEEAIRQRQIIESDERRNNEAIKMKQILDNCHKQIIDNVLSKFKFGDGSLEGIFNVYTQNDDTRKDKLEKIQEKMRKDIAKAFKAAGIDNKFGSKFNDFVKKELSNYAQTDAERETVAYFKNFVTYFTGFNTNRMNMYSEEAKSTAISFRLVNQNLTKYMDNILAFQKIANTLPVETLSKIYEDFKSNISQSTLDAFFSITNYNNAITQRQIEAYNAVIGGRKDKDDKIIVKGINQYVNEYNQIHKDGRLPKLTRLFNQILSDRDSVSERPVPFKNAKEAVSAINDSYANVISKSITTLSGLSSKIDTFDTNGIYLKWDEDIRFVSNKVYGYYNHIHDIVADNWKIANPQGKKKADSYNKNLIKYIKSIESLSLKTIYDICNDNKVAEYFTSLGAENRPERQRENLTALVVNKFNAASFILNDPNITDDEFRKNSYVVKELLDATKDAQRFFKLLCGSGDEAQKDHTFYDDYISAYEALDYTVNQLYNKVRNFVTKKDYSADKFKLSFESSSFLSGWAQKSEYSKSAAFIFMKDEQYYLGISVARLSKEDIAYLEDSDMTDIGQRVVYNFQKADSKNAPRQFIRSKGGNFAPSIQRYNLPIKSILEIYDKGYFKTDYRKDNPAQYKESLIKLIDYYKLGFSKHESYQGFELKWRDSKDYDNISEFFADVQGSCYKIDFIDVNWEKLIEFTEQGKFYLFRIANKDFSGYSKGRPNLHTLYWKMLFDERNLKDVVYKMSGNAEIFMRYASLKNPIVHKANKGIKNKCPYTEKEESLFAYDIIKDRRFTVDQFEFHVPIMMNFKRPEKVMNFNNDFLQLIKDGGIKHVIGIDRGERNLLYMVVTDLDGNIVEQKSLNQVASNPQNSEYRQDYHRLLNDKANANTQARRDWQTIENVKDIKFGYLSQIVHEIAEAVVKYDAIVVLENLNRGFMQKRGLENNVYQKFEKMLIDKLGYYVDKTKQADEPGGVLHALQLADSFANFNSKQSNSIVRQTGVVFFVPAWLTSKIDPVSGFASFIKFHRDDSMAAIKSTISKFDSIQFDSNRDIFKFGINYDNFENASKGGKRNWTVCSYGTRILTERDPEQNNAFVSKPINLTEEFKALFNTNGINLDSNLKDEICKINDAQFFKKLSKLLSLTFQMRNSNANTDEDYIISPVADENGSFFDSRENAAGLPQDADANGAYNIARKGLMLIEQLGKCNNIPKFEPELTNADWLNYAQRK